MAIANSFYDDNPDWGAPLAPAIGAKPDLTVLDGGERLRDADAKRPDLTLLKRDGTSKSVDEVLDPRSLAKAKKTREDFIADHERHKADEAEPAEIVEGPKGPQNLREQAAFIADHYREKTGNISSDVKGEMAKVREKVETTLLSMLGVRKRRPEDVHRPLELIERPFEGTSLSLGTGESIDLIGLKIERDDKVYIAESVSDIGQLIFKEEGGEGQVAIATPWELFMESKVDLSGLTESQERELKNAISTVVDMSLLGPENFFALPNGESINLLGVSFEKDGVNYVTKSVSDIGQIICLSIDGKGASLVLNSPEDLLLQENIDLGELTPKQDAGVKSMITAFLDGVDYEKRRVTLVETKMGTPFEGEILILPNGAQIDLLSLALKSEGQSYRPQRVTNSGQLVFWAHEGEATIVMQNPWELFMESELDVAFTPEQQTGLNELISKVVDASLLGSEKLMDLPNGKSLNLLGIKFEENGVTYVAKSVSSLGQVYCMSIDGKGASLVLNSAEDLLLQENIDLGELTSEQEEGVKAYISGFVDRVIDENKIEKRSVQLTGDKMEAPFEGEILILPNGEAIDLLTLTLDHNGQAYRAARVTDRGQLVFWVNEGNDTIAFANPWDLFVSDDLNENALTADQKKGLNMIEMPDLVGGLADKPFAAEEFSDEGSFQNYALPNGETIDLTALRIKRAKKVYEIHLYQKDIGTLYFIDASKKGDRSKLDSDLAFTTPRELFEAEGIEAHQLTVAQIAGLTMMGCNLSSSSESSETRQDRFWSYLGQLASKYLDKGETVEADISLKALKNGLLEFANTAMGQADPELSLLSRLEGVEGVEANELTSADGRVYALLVSLGKKQFYVPVRPEMRFHAFALDDQVFDLNGSDPEDISIRSIVRLPEFKRSKSQLWELERQGEYISSFEALVPEEDSYERPFQSNSFSLENGTIIYLTDLFFKTKKGETYEYINLSTEGEAKFSLVKENGVKVSDSQDLIFNSPHVLLKSEFLDYKKSFSPEGRTELAELGYEDAGSLDLEGHEEEESSVGARRWLFAHLAGLYFSMKEGVFDDSELEEIELREFDPKLKDLLEEEVEAIKEVEIEGDEEGQDPIKKSRKESLFWGIVARLYASLQSDDDPALEAQRDGLDPSGEHVEVLSESHEFDGLAGLKLEHEATKERVDIPLGPPPALDTEAPSEAELLSDSESSLEEPKSVEGWRDKFFKSMVDVFGRFMPEELEKGTMEASDGEAESPRLDPVGPHVEVLDEAPVPPPIDTEIPTAVKPAPTPIPTPEPELEEAVLSEGAEVEEADTEGGFQNWFFGTLVNVFGRFVSEEPDEEVIEPSNIEVLSAEVAVEEIPEADIEVISTEAITAASDWNRLAEEGNGELPYGYKVSGKNPSIIVSSVTSESRGGSYLLPSTLKMNGSPALVNLWFEVENAPAGMDAHSLEDYELVSPAWVKDPNNIAHLYAPNDTFTGKPDPEILVKGVLRYIGPQA